MAARPNAHRTLVYGQRLAENHVTRLTEMIEMCDRVVEENKLLTPDEIEAYKECARTGRKQLTLFTKLAELGIPNVDTSTSRRSRGRPSKAELATLSALRKGGASKKVSKKAVAAPKAADPVVPAKRKGRPPKAAATAVSATPVVATAKRRGRPPKAATSAAAAAPVAAPRKPGRPKGSGNQTKLLNGSNKTETATAAVDVSESA